ncbi:hypothetical protein VNO78_26257 [Psophocarpus tetragonolobus]|uniref:Uncharacterized protein n=1 Tax=Psophocarpus tetragonolobus TaxID=3891 RepID=A0AAN9S0D1_PSOTE
MHLLLPQHHHHNLSFSQCPFFHNSIKTLNLCVPNIPTRASTIIRMGGGPRTYPGGVSKWQWKRMQAKKAKQLLKARLCRERQIYEMRKRAELKAAVSELERPWEVVRRESAAAPNLFSVEADEQVKVLADRFQRPGGFDLWSDRDGPMLFESPDELPSARFFPKGVVHSVKPYRRVDGYGLLKGGCDDVKVDAFGGGLSEMENGREGVEFGGELSENGIVGEGIEFGGDLSENGIVGEGIEFGEDLSWRGGLLEDVDGFELEGDDRECSSSYVNYGRNGVEGDGGLRRNENGGRIFYDDAGSDGRLSSRLSYGKNGVDGDGGLSRNVSGRRFLSSSNGKTSSPLNYGRNGVDSDGRLSRNGSGRRFLSSSDGERSSPLNYGRNGVDDDGGLRRNKKGNGRRFLSSSDGERSSHLNHGRNGVDGDGRLRRNGNGRRVLSNNEGKFSDEGRSSRFNYGRKNGLNVDERMRRNGNGSKYVSRGVDGADDGGHSSRTLGSGRYEATFDGKVRSKGNGRRVLSKDVDRSGDGRLRRMESGRRFVSKDVDRSNGLYSRGVGSVRKQRGGNSIGGRSRGKYTNKTSNYASPQGRGANSEVYDMGLQQDGSYRFLQKHEQPDSTGW